jgi:23S rRNA pseudouridine2605 synthase
MESESASIPDGRVRLARLIAHRGLASRREAERMIEAGEVLVNGVAITEQGTMVDPVTDHVRVEGRSLPAEAPKRYFVMYKPKGTTTAAEDEQGRDTIHEYVERLPVKVSPVGRLDFNVEGALLLTNDGDLANRLLHPSSSVPKRYVAKVYRTPTERDLQAIERGVTFPEGRSKPAKARVLEQTDGDNAWVEITITENGPRVVHRILGQLGHPVSKLRRESFATVSIRGMQRGEIRELAADEVARIKDIASGKKPQVAGRGWKGVGFAKAKPKPSRRKQKRG